MATASKGKRARAAEPKVCFDFLSKSMLEEMLFINSPKGLTLVDRIECRGDREYFVWGVSLALEYVGMDDAFEVISGVDAARLMGRVFEGDETEGGDE